MTFSCNLLTMMVRFTGRQFLDSLTQFYKQNYWCHSLGLSYTFTKLKQLIKHPNILTWVIKCQLLWQVIGKSLKPQKTTEVFLLSCKSYRYLWSLTDQLKNSNVSIVTQQPRLRIKFINLMRCSSNLCPVSLVNNKPE